MKLAEALAAAKDALENYEPDSMTREIALADLIDPVEGCCLLAIPNTSSWQVVCSGSVTAPTVIPTLSEWGLMALALALAFVAIRRVK